MHSICAVQPKPREKVPIQMAYPEKLGLLGQVEQSYWRALRSSPCIASRLRLYPEQRTICGLQFYILLVKETVQERV
jgi:hypothetical protein